MIVIDPRLGSAPDWLKSMDALKVPYELRTLEFGDVTFTGNGPQGKVQIGIELKKVLDFVNGIASGRLAGHQLPGLAQEYDHAWLLVEGFYRARRGDGLAEVPAGAKWRPLRLGRRPIFWRDLESFLTSVEVQVGVRVRRTRTPHETARSVVLLYEWFQKPYAQHKTFKTLYVAPAPVAIERGEGDKLKRRLRLGISALVPMIGWERSAEVVARLPSVEAMCDATEDEWAEIPGIGKKVAAAAVKGLHERIADASTRGASVQRSRGARA